MLEMLRDVPPSASRLMLVGHNPEIQALALDLVGSGPKHYRDKLEEKYPTAGLAVVNFTSGELEGRHGEQRRASTLPYAEGSQGLSISGNP